MTDKLKVLGAAGGAMGLGGFAAALGLCCSVPWAVAIFGVSGAIAFARLAFLLPYSLAGAAALLGLGFWLAYRKPVCARGACPPQSLRRLRLVLWVTAVVVVAMAVVLVPRGAASATDATAAPAYTLLGDDFSQLREDFNRARGSVRLLFVVDPICPGCLRGMDDMNDDLLSRTRDARLQTFVVHVPVIGAKAKDVTPAARVLENPHVRNYWNASGEFGRALASAVQLKNGDETVYAWDVWLLYGPDAEWIGDSIPQPALLMHQLWKLEGTKFPQLDSAAFAREVHNRLQALSADTATRK
jgi:hypothetical protein